MKINFFSLLLNFILALSVIICYHYGNFDGADLKKQKQFVKKQSTTKKPHSQNLLDIKSDSLALKKLKQKIKIIENDNQELSDAKENMVNIIKKMKKDFAKQRDALLRQNSRQINETEEQHYKNISELTKKINELKRENIKLSEENNIEIIALKAKINILNDKLTKIKKQKNPKQ